MAVKPGEHVLVVTDVEQREVGEALRKAASRITPGKVRLRILEELAARPIVAIPEKLVQDIQWANVTFYAAHSMKGEVGMRLQLIRLARKYARHGHLINITKQLMEEGMCADYRKISKVTHKVHERVRQARTIRVTNPAGTDLVVEFDPTWRWIPYDGLYHEKGTWGNLPEGEVTTAARKASGRIVVNELGDYFDRKYGILTASPVVLDVHNSRADLVSIACSNAELKAELTSYLETDANSNRLGEFALGTNIFLTRLVGNLLQDEKLPTVHVAFGDPYSEETGADWTSKTHIDCIIMNSSVWVDGEKIMQSGSYTL